MAVKQSNVCGPGSPSFRLGALEFSLLASAVALLFQLFPAGWFRLSQTLDPRSWSALTWLVVVAAGAGILVRWRGSSDWRDTFGGMFGLSLLAGLVLVGAMVIFFPDAWAAVLAALDARKWSKATWFVVNLAGVAALVVIRYLPDWKAAWSARRKDVAQRKQRDLQAQQRKEQQARTEELGRQGRKGIDFY
jgi:hypothetical protein